ncbi:sensor domain-containing diguanylate cyclase [Shewanella inventionis]|uniref:diguanylate cyclase n=1 Tax=Shewanella inventionis TaxID=1738770 RepID=UPI001CC01422|nr:diguanylate cyclase [Shewanella inventionis]UAL41999.1 sensor domain-containing diguanylate cyclase [Shewanella inventionis]
MLLFFCSFYVASKPVELTNVADELFISQQLAILQVTSGDVSFEEALSRYRQGDFVPNHGGKVSFGFTRDVIWTSVLINNASNLPIKKFFYLDSAWLDSANFYFVRQNKLVANVFTGDTLPFSSRRSQTRMISEAYEFKPGLTQVLIRFESKDPLLIPLYLTTEKMIQRNLEINNYFYGFLYGAFLMLLVYNIVLSVSLKDSRYIYYSLYLLSFLSLNVAYTGHGFKLFWPEALFVQRWAMIFFLYCYILFGIAFCFEFLKLKTYLPRVYRLNHLIYASLILLMLGVFIYGDQLLAVNIGVALTSSLVVIFISLGLLALKNGHVMVKFFIPAVFLGAGGAAFSAATTWGAIPYNTFLFHGIEIGMLIEMSILALALAFNLKEVDKARITAEVIAQYDHLTGLYNRRAFTVNATPLWELGVREQTPFSMILLDIDWFKTINDQYGHAVGDLALKTIANTLKQHTRKSDVLARWGGEEFILFLPNTSKLAAMQFANDIREKIAAIAVFHEGGVLSVTASFGVAEYHCHMKKLEELIKLADKALYQAKNSGRNIVCDISAPDTLTSQPQDMAQQDAV